VIWLPIRDLKSKNQEASARTRRAAAVATGLPWRTSSGRFIQWVVPLATGRSAIRKRTRTRVRRGKYLNISSVPSTPTGMIGASLPGRNAQHRSLPCVNHDPGCASLGKMPSTCPFSSTCSAYRAAHSSFSPRRTESLLTGENDIDQWVGEQLRFAHKKNQAWQGQTGLGRHRMGEVVSGQHDRAANRHIFYPARLDLGAQKEPKPGRGGENLPCGCIFQENNACDLEDQVERCESQRT